MEDLKTVHVLFLSGFASYVIHSIHIYIYMYIQCIYTYMIVYASLLKFGSGMGILTRQENMIQCNGFSSGSHF